MNLSSALQDAAKAVENGGRSRDVYYAMVKKYDSDELDAMGGKKRIMSRLRQQSKRRKNAIQGDSSISMASAAPANN